VTTRQATELERDRTAAAADLEPVFRLHYGRITKLIARITRDPGRAEELAVEVFLRWPPADASDDRAISGWLTKTSIRLALDEIRRQDRRGRLARFAARFGTQPSPEDALLYEDQRGKVVRTLSKLKPRDAELLTLRGEGLSYEELATVLSIKPASIGKLISRAQNAFRKEYLKRHGKTD
jgi:RNA polymerase sigma-70 factor, ECF subfamily